MRMGMLPRVATTISENSSGRVSRPTADREFAHALLETAARQLEILRAQRRRHVRGRQLVGVETIGIELDLDLPAARAEEDHLADAVDRFHALLDVLLEEGELDRGQRRRDREHHDRHRVGVLLLHDRRIGGLGQVADDGSTLAANLLRGDVGVLREVER